MTPYKPPRERIKIKRNSAIWKRLVKRVQERDRYRCQVCDNIFPKNMLAPHHVKTVGAGGDDAQYNLISVCQFCHNDLHKGVTMIPAISKQKYKSRIPTRQQWVEYEREKSLIQQTSKTQQEEDKKLEELRERLGI